MSSENKKIRVKNTMVKIERGEDQNHPSIVDKRKINRYVYRVCPMSLRVIVAD
jgi:hypothetical protein